MIAPAQLWIGEELALTTACYNYLKKIYCFSPEHKSDCLICHKIEQRKHHLIYWLTSEKQYTKEMLEPIFETIAFMLASNSDKFFFIIPKADLLTAAAANSLLKIIEEPPSGYHFIFFSQRPSLVLPTIKSRCIVQHIAGMSEQKELDKIVAFFKNATLDNTILLIDLLDKMVLTEQIIVELLDKLLNNWQEAYHEYITKKEEIKAQLAYKRAILLSSCYEQLPMPGSAKYFLRDLYLQLSLISKRE